MSWIERHTVNVYKAKGVAAYFKVRKGNIKQDGGALFKLAVDNDGIYYYGKYAHVLTDAEKDSTLKSYYAFISMEDLQEVFEALMKAGLHRRSAKSGRVTARRVRRTVVIEEAPETEDS